MEIWEHAWITIKVLPSTAYSKKKLFGGSCVIIHKHSYPNNDLEIKTLARWNQYAHNHILPCPFFVEAIYQSICRQFARADKTFKGPEPGLPWRFGRIERVSWLPLSLHGSTPVHMHTHTHTLACIYNMKTLEIIIHHHLHMIIINHHLSFVMNLVWIMKRF